MAYVQTSWQDYPNTSTPVTSAQLDRMEAGIGYVSPGAAGTSGQFVGNGPIWTYPPGHEFGYDAITSSVNVVSTTEATGTTIITCSAHTFDGAAVWAHFFSSQVQGPVSAGQKLVVSLFESSTQIGEMAIQNQPGTNAVCTPVNGWLRFTPSNASHTYTVTAFVDSTTGTPFIGAGAGGTAAKAPAFIRFFKV